MTSFEIRSMQPDDYPAVMALWNSSEGIGLSQADSEQGIARFLERNTELSLVAEAGSVIVGAILCGHDGRRGYIHHLVVAHRYRHLGIGRSLVDGCLRRLRQAGIQKCHLFVFATNLDARAFWNQIGWNERAELVMVSKYL